MKSVALGRLALALGLAALARRVAYTFWLQGSRPSAIRPPQPRRLRMG